MVTRSRQSISQISGIALAAFVVASMSVHDQKAVADAQNSHRAGVSAFSNADIVSVERSTPALHATKVDLDGIVPNIIHHY